MKMENILKAPADATVKKITAKKALRLKKIRCLFSSDKRFTKALQPLPL
jgi:acetyl/propionyl-CoA carboxylase alpha subunit